MIQVCRLKAYDQQRQAKLKALELNKLSSDNKKPPRIPFNIDITPIGASL